MAVTGKVFGYASASAFGKDSHWAGWNTSSTIKAILLLATASARTGAADLYAAQYVTYFTTGTNYESVDASYSRQQLAAAGTTSSVSQTNTGTDFLSTGTTNGLAGGVQWTSLTTANAVRYVLLADCSTSDATAPVICYFDLGASYTFTSGTLALTFGADGSTNYTVFKISTS